jgi:RNA polymerase sigma factor (sigma-70 family)
VAGVAVSHGEAMAVSDPAAARAADDLYRTHAADVYRYALAVLGQPADAEDVTQTTFLRAYRSLERGVRPRKPASWLLTIASNVLKERFRKERSRATEALVDDPAADEAVGDDETPTIGELLAALRVIPPLQRQAIVLREFEGRSYAEIAEILGVTTSALETLLFRARRSLAEELQSRVTCADAQLSLSRAADGRLGRKERRRLREHLEECAECAHFARIQQRHRRAFRGLALVPVPVSIGLFRGLDTPTAAAAALTPAAATGASSVGGILGSTVALKAATVVTAATVAGGVGVVGATNVEPAPPQSVPVRADVKPQPTGRVARPIAPVPVARRSNDRAQTNGKAIGRADRPAVRAAQPGKLRAAIPDRSRAPGVVVVPKAPSAGPRSTSRGNDASRAHAPMRGRPSRVAPGRQIRSERPKPAPGPRQMRAAPRGATPVNGPPPGKASDRGGKEKRRP